MTDKQIFQNLFEVAKMSKDPEGVVSACIAKNGEILVSSASADDGVRHAEDLVIEKASKNGIEIDENCVLYTTLEPCSYRNPKNGVEDCTTIILKTPIKKIIFGANDPEYSKEARNRFEASGVEITQIEDKELIKICVELFNSTVEVDLTSMGLPRKKKLPE